MEALVDDLVRIATDTGVKLRVCHLLECPAITGLSLVISSGGQEDKRGTFLPSRKNNKQIFIFMQDDYSEHTDFKSLTDTYLNGDGSNYGRRMKVHIEQEDVKIELWDLIQKVGDCILPVMRPALVGALPVMLRLLGMSEARPCTFHASFTIQPVYLCFCAGLLCVITSSQAPYGATSRKAIGACQVSSS